MSTAAQQTQPASAHGLIRSAVRHALPCRSYRSLVALVLASVALLVFNVAQLRQSISIQGQTAQQSQSELLLLQPDPKVEFVQGLWLASQRGPQQPRGLVLPLYDAITVKGKSLILELRSMDVDLPIEIPHCGDLPADNQWVLTRNDSLVRIYDVCEEAVMAETSQGDKLFCNDIGHCHELFRTFYIKPLAVVFSRFQEIMMLDADTIHFRSPMDLWETDKYKTTGTLFFHDRVAWELEYLDAPYPGQDGITWHHHVTANFDVAPYGFLGRIPRPNASSASRARSMALPVTLPFEPSDFLLTSHSWNRRSGMEMDSSVLLWNKKRQPRATAILASFIALNQPERPPSYGDKEFFFIACELAETAYAFSDFGVGVAGWDRKALAAPNSSIPHPTLCGDILQFYPERVIAQGDDPAALDAMPQFMNGDLMFTWDPTQTRLFRAKARAADFYAGYGLPQFCPFNTTIIPFTQHENTRLSERRKMVDAVCDTLEAVQARNRSLTSENP